MLRFFTRVCFLKVFPETLVALLFRAAHVRLGKPLQFPDGAALARVGKCFVRLLASARCHLSRAQSESFEKSAERAVVVVLSGTLLGQCFHRRRIRDEFSQFIRAFDLFRYLFCAGHVNRPGRRARSTRARRRRPAHVRPSALIDNQ